VNNELYLILSYFVVGTISLLMAFAAYALLRRSFTDLSKTVPGGRLGLIFRKVFLLGLVLPALAGFFSVTFRSCGKETYKAIIADKSYLVGKNQEQLGTSMLYICIALLVWGLLVLIGFVRLDKKIKEGD
jgi:hypothetical protein